MLEVQLPTATGVLDDGQMDGILSSLQKVYSYVQDNSDVLSKSDGAKQIMDAVGEVGLIVHSFACFRT